MWEGERHWKGTRFGLGCWLGLGVPDGSTTETNKVPIYSDNVLRRHFEFISCYRVWSTHNHAHTLTLTPLHPKGTNTVIVQGRSTGGATALKLNWMINHNWQLSKRIKAPGRDLCLLLVTMLWSPAWDQQPLYWQCQVHLQNDGLLPQLVAPKHQKGTGGDTNPSWSKALGDGSGCSRGPDHARSRRAAGGQGDIRQCLGEGRSLGYVPNRGGGVAAPKQVSCTFMCSWLGASCQEEVSEVFVTVRSQPSPTKTPSQATCQTCVSEEQRRGAKEKIVPPAIGWTSGWSCLRCPHEAWPGGMEQVS